VIGENIRSIRILNEKGIRAINNEILKFFLVISLIKEVNNIIFITIL
jgi:hypothetical protein